VFNPAKISDRSHRTILHRTATKLLLPSILCICLNAASLPPVSAPATIEPPEETALPISPTEGASPVILDSQLKSLHRALISSRCKVAPLSEIDDPEALTYEKNAESGLSDVDGLMPETAQALDTFKDLVTSLGGTFDLKSAYRPAAYQAHLHEVWVKWVKDLRNNRTAGCRALREEVQAEFQMHQLLVRQQPVPLSDHALGLAFDAAVMMPRAARLNGKRVTVDKLAAIAGIKRPNTRRDPVHFKLLPAMLLPISRLQTPDVSSGD